MASSSPQHLSADLHRNNLQSSLNSEETILGLVDFPSLDEAFGANGRRIENPRNIPHLGLENNRSNLEIIEEVISEKNSNPSPVLAPKSNLKFIPPDEIKGKKVVAAQSENFKAEISDCEKLVVGFFAGKRGSFAAVKFAVSNLWKLKKEVSIKLHGDSAFIFEFMDDEDRKKALEIGSFYIGKSLFSLRPWSHLIEKSISCIKKVPIWVKIFGVPLHMWNDDGLSLIASYIGIPLMADECTLKKDRLAFARICVEIDVECAYPENIPLLIDGKFAMDLPVEYQWKPAKCETCMVFGHLDKNCPRKMKTRWNPRKDRVIKLQPKLPVGIASGENVIRSAKSNADEDKSFDCSDPGILKVRNSEQPMGFSIATSIDKESSLKISPEKNSSCNDGENMRSQDKVSQVETTTSGPVLSHVTTDCVTGANLCANTDATGKERSNSYSSAPASFTASNFEQVKTSVKEVKLKAKPVENSIDSGSLAKSVEVQARPKHNPFRMLSDYPYQWKDLEKDNTEKRDNKVKETEAVSNKSGDRVVVSKTSPVKSVSINADTSASEGGWTEVKRKKNSPHKLDKMQQSPKNKVGNAERREVLNPSSSKVSSYPKSIEDSEDAEVSVCVKHLKFLSREEMNARRKERELRKKT